MELDGFRVFISGKSNGGKGMVISSLTSLIMERQWETYIKHLEVFAEKKKKIPNYLIDPLYDKITQEENVLLYDIYCQKSITPLFNSTLCSSVSPALLANEEKFMSLSVENQALLLLTIGSVFKTGRKGGCDLTSIGGKENIGSLILSSRVSNWKKTYTTAYIIDTDAAGLYETRSQYLV